MRKPVIAGLTLGVLFTLGALRALDLSWWRTQTLTTASAHASNLAYILSEYFRESLAAGDSVLRQLALHSQRIGGPSAPAGDWNPSLASARAGLRNTGSISVADAAGTIRHSTQPLIVGQSRRDESAFRKLATDPSDDLAIGKPYPTVDRNAFVIPFERPLFRADGAFDGVVVATMAPAAMRNLFQTMDVGRHGAVWVFHPDGIVLFREPSSTNPIGEPASDNPIFAAAMRSETPGTLESPVQSGGPTMLTAFRKTTAPPLVVAVALDRDEVLHDWWRQVAGSVAFFVVLAMTMMGTLFVLFRQMDQRADMERALAHARQSEAERLRAANDQLESALRLEQEFLMTVSHELRTPLTAIYGWARMLGTGAVREEQRTAAIQSIERNARAQTRLVEDLLDMSRVVGGKLRLDVREVVLPDVLKLAVETMTPAAEAKRIRIETTIEGSVMPITGDTDRLQQVFWNLLSNAIKFTPAGGRVELRLARAGSDVVIRVNDTGAGISPEFLPHVFDRFRQEDSGSKRRFGGLGLGLAIVKHLVELHGGSVAVESEGQGQGATFTVRLPADRASIASPILGGDGDAHERTAH